MPLILDTCAAIWIVAGAKLASAAEEAITRARKTGEPIYVSPISAWEVGLLASKGRFASPLPPKTWFSRLMSNDPLRPADLTASILIDSCFLPGQPPRDPSDKIIIATAREHDLTVTTRDQHILNYGSAGHVRVLAC